MGRWHSIADNITVTGKIAKFYAGKCSKTPGWEPHCKSIFGFRFIITLSRMEFALVSKLTLPVSVTAPSWYYLEIKTCATSHTHTHTHTLTLTLKMVCAIIGLENTINVITMATVNDTISKTLYKPGDILQHDTLSVAEKLLNDKGLLALIVTVL